MDLRKVAEKIREDWIHNHPSDIADFAEAALIRVDMEAFKRGKSMTRHRYEDRIEQLETVLKSILQKTDGNNCCGPCRRVAIEARTVLKGDT
jgi:hypothetical protein